MQDNITRLDQGSRTLRHQYDATTNRLSGANNAAGTSLFTVTHDICGNQTSRTRSVDPVAADPGNGSNFNRCWYANNS